MSERRASTLLTLASLVVVLAGMKLAASLLMPIFLALFLSVVTHPLVTRLRAIKIPAALSIIIAVILEIAAVVFMAWLLVGSVDLFYARLPDYEARLSDFIRNTSESWAKRGFSVTPDELFRVADPNSIMSLVGATLSSVAGLVSNLVLVFIIVIFMLFEAAGLGTKLESISPGLTKSTGPISRTMQEMQKYLAVKTATSLLTAFCVGSWIAALGIDFPLLWALLAFLLNYVPTVGSIIAAIPPLLVCLAIRDGSTTIVFAMGYILINSVIGNFLEPRVLGRALGLSPLVVFLSMIFWGWILGPLGALLSVPLTMMIKLFLSNTEDFQWIATILGPVPTTANPDMHIDKPLD